MAQLNLHVTPRFENALGRLMRARGLKSKSEAIRLAVEEAAERAARGGTARDFSVWRGAAIALPGNSAPRFASDRDLWE